MSDIDLKAISVGLNAPFLNKKDNAVRFTSKLLTAICLKESGFRAIFLRTAFVNTL